VNGDKYCGKWDLDTRQGPGTYIMKDSQTQLTGNWNANGCQSGIWEFFDGRHFYGVFHQSKIHHYYKTKEEADKHLATLVKVRQLPPLLLLFLSSLFVVNPLFV
jgi:hypothetical protein